MIDHGKIIKARREELGLTQEQLAELAATKQQNVTRIENGVKSKYIPAVLAALGLDAEGKIIHSDDDLLANVHQLFLLFSSNKKPTDNLRNPKLDGRLLLPLAESIYQNALDVFHCDYDEESIPTLAKNALRLYLSDAILVDHPRKESLPKTRASSEGRKALKKAEREQEDR